MVPNKILVELLPGYGDLPGNYGRVVTDATIIRFSDGFRKTLPMGTKIIFDDSPSDKTESSLPKIGNKISLNDTEYYVIDSSQLIGYT